MADITPLLQQLQQFRRPTISDEIQRQIASARSVIDPQIQAQQQLQNAIAKAMIEGQIKQNMQQKLAEQRFKQIPEIMKIFNQDQGMPNQQSSTPVQSGQAQSELQQMGSPFISKPSYSLDPFSGEFKVGISQVNNPFFQQKMDIKTATEKAEALQEIKSKVPTSQQKNDLQGVRQQIENVNQLEDLAKDIPGGYLGAGSIMLGSISRGKYATDTRRYLKTLPAFAAGLYRDLTGDKRLSDEDAAARAMPLLWHPSEDEEIKKNSFNDIRQALRNREKMIQSGQYKVTPDGDFITPLDSVLKNSSIKNSQPTREEAIAELRRRGKI